MWGATLGKETGCPSELMGPGRCVRKNHTSHLLTQRGLLCFSCPAWSSNKHSLLSPCLSPLGHQDKTFTSATYEVAAEECAWASEGAAEAPRGEVLENQR